VLRAVAGRRVEVLRHEAQAQRQRPSEPAAAAAAAAGLLDVEGLLHELRRGGGGGLSGCGGGCNGADSPAAGMG
jgi:hypothetical protein